MRILLLAGLALLAAVSAGVFYSHLNRGSSPVPAEIVAKYAAWKKVFGKLYATPSENDHRLRVFYGQWQFVEESNNQYNDAMAKKGEKLSGPMFEINEFDDLSDEEFDVKFNGAKLTEDELFEHVTPAETVKEDKNLAQSAGYQIIVRKQGSCASCWAHAAVACIEKHYWDKFHQRLSFSHQMIIDCDKRSGDCRGGYEGGAMDFSKATGLALASTYPYTASNGVCNAWTVPRLNVQITKVIREPFTTANAALRVNQGKHITGGVYSKGKFRHLSSTDDIYDGPSSGECSKTVNHAINLVEASGDVFKVLNSYGTGWAVNGMKRIRACLPNTLYGLSSPTYCVE